MVGTIRVRAILLVSLLAVILVTGLTTSGVLAGDNPHARPFRASMEGTFFPVNDGHPCFIFGLPGPVCAFELDGEGNATHMGTFVEDASWVIEFEGPISGFIQSGTATLTGANGDSIELSAVSGGRLDDFTIDADFDIVGGTGRFEGASGSITRTGVFSAEPPAFLGTFDVTYTGTITY